MKMSGEYLVPASRDVVWAALNDPEVLKGCLVGCEKLDKVSDTAFEAVLAAKVGPIKAKFSGAVKLSELDPPNSYLITGEGKGGTAGVAKGSARVRLKDGESVDVTVLDYAVDARLGGKLAQMGSRVIEPVAKRMADDFFGKLAETIAKQSDAPAPVAEAVVAQPTGAPGPPIWRWIGIAVGIGALAILGSLFFGGG